LPGRETSGGILLLACTLAALVWANSPWAHHYAALWHTPFSVGLGGFQLSHEIHFWVNDALMALFFFVVGLEIKRELLAGELLMANLLESRGDWSLVQASTVPPPLVRIETCPWRITKLA
jgi:Na+/H+ antiporter NhaA